ncbi:MAG: hypothetical protein M1820_009070 [Bogoriella megaspora]|nr:MAG: hypothetical protein M1820_009070 [Bogoriella megaspora]
MPGDYCLHTYSGNPVLQDDCTADLCMPQCGQINYEPTLAGNAVYLAFFVLLFIAQLFLCIRYKTFGFLIGMFGGIALEALGYGGRVGLNQDIFNFNWFLLYLIPLTIGPAFLSGSIYICLGRIININGVNLSRFSPRTYAMVFVACDLLSLILQAAGGGIAATADTPDSSNTGKNVMIAGLVFQVFSLLLFLAFWGEFALRVRKAGEAQKNTDYASLRASRYFHWFQYSLLAATILILIRSIFRVVELQGGFDGTVANNEASFMVFEGPMIILAVGALTVCHPGLALRGAWQTAAWSFKKNVKQDVGVVEMNTKYDYASSAEINTHA